MKKKLIAVFMAVVMALGMVVPAGAITPADGLIASALYSFVLSAGVKLFRDGGIAGTDEMVHDMQTVYDEYLQYDATGSTWEQMGQGVVVNEGRIVLTKDTAQTMQGFTNWLATAFDGKPGKKITLIEAGPGTPTNLGTFTLPQSELELLSGYGQYWEAPIYTSVGPLEVRVYRSGVYQRDYLYQVKNNTDTVYLICGETSTQWYFWYISEGTFEVDQFGRNSMDGEYSLVQTLSINTLKSISSGVQRPNRESGEFAYYNYPMPQSKSDREVLSLFTPNILTDSNKMSVLAYIVMAGDRTAEQEQPEVGAVFGPTVSDLTTGLADDQALAIDIGVGANADEEEIVGTILGDYAIPDGATDIQAVATPIPIEGVEELYPQPAVTDIENLGLPDLGAALTSRFPFCIPWDFVNVYRSLSAEAVAPVITVDLFPQSFKSKIGISGNTSFTIDFTDQKYSTFLTLIRWGSLVAFVLALAFATKRLIWTTGG